MSETRLELQIVESSQGAIKGLDNLISALGRVQSAVGKGLNFSKAVSSLKDFSAAVAKAVPDDTLQKLERIGNALEKIKQNKTINLRIKASTSEAQQKVKEATEAVTKAKDSGTTDVGSRMEEMSASIKDAGKKAEESKSAFDKLKAAIRGLAGESKRSSGALAKLVRSFGRIAYYRMIRAAIKAITEGVKEGTANYREYSKAIGSTFAKAMSNADNALLKMKNSIGAALAPALQMLIPYVIQVINWFIQLMNIINQFLALLRGQSTWSRATDVSAEALEKTKEGAKEAGKEIKNLLADWDELNIIQSESGGGSGSGLKTDDTENYLKMFEEVGVFDSRVAAAVEKVKEAVKFIQESFNKIRKISAYISGVLQSWGIPKDVSDFVGSLLAFTVGLPIILTFDLTTKFNERYLETKDAGYLLENILVTAFGAFVAGKLVKSLTGSSNLGFIAASIPIIVSATADVITYLGNTDVSALSGEGLSLAILSALKVGGVAMFLAHSIGKLGYFKSGMIGLGATGLVLGATIGLKAVFESEADLSEITKDNAETLLLGSGIFGAGVALLTKTLGKKSLGTSLLSGVGATIGTGLLLGAAIDLKAVLSGNVDPSEITETTVRGAVEGAAGIAAYVFTAAKASGQETGVAFGTTASAAIGTGLIIAAGLGVKALLNGEVDDSEITSTTIKTVLEGSAGIAAYVVSAMNNTKYSGTGGAFQAAGAVFATGLFISAGVGIKAMLDNKPDTGEVTDETIKEIVKNSLMTAGGIALLAKSIGLVGMAGALGVGAIGAVATGLVLYAVVSAKVSVDKSNIAWGDYQATEEEIKKFVDEKLFNAKARVTLQLIKHTVEMDDTEKAKVEAAAGELFTTLNVLQLGVDKPTSIMNLKSQFDDLRGALASYASSRTTALKTSITLSPVVSESGEDLSAAFLKDSLTGWDLINNGMSALGEELSQTFIDSTTGKLKENWDEEAAQAILEKVAAINSAVLGQQIISAAKSGLQEGLLGLDRATSDQMWNKNSFDKAMELYDDYIDQMRKGFVRMFQGDAEAAETEAAWLRGLLPSITDDALRKQYEDQIETLEAQAKVLRSQVQARVEAAMRENAGSGEEVLRDTFVSMLNTDKISKALSLKQASIITEFKKATAKGMNLSEALNEAIKQNMMTSTNLRDLVPYIERFGINAFSLLSDPLKEKIAEIFQFDLSELTEDLPDEEVEFSFDWSESGIDATVPTPDASSFNTSFDDMVTKAQSSVEAITEAVQSLDGMSFAFSWDSPNGGTFSVTKPKPVAMAAEGGMFTAGEMFVAREAGPEMVGRMGTRSTVANNDQIVAGIAGGVAAGQSEQNNLLRQQNDYLRRLLEKESTVRVQPSTAWGEFTKKSSDMYARATGRG